MAREQWLYRQGSGGTALIGCLSPESRHNVKSLIKVSPKTMPTHLWLM
jgi:hypothetical protein